MLSVKLLSTVGILWGFLTLVLIGLDKGDKERENRVRLLRGLLFITAMGIAITMIWLGVW